MGSRVQRIVARARSFINRKPLVAFPIIGLLLLGGLAALAGVTAADDSGDVPTQLDVGHAAANWGGSWFATPPPPVYQLTINLHGTAGDAVTYLDRVCQIPPTKTDYVCTFLHPAGGTLPLLVRPGTASIFGGWTGACTGTDGICNTQGNATQVVTASFRRAANATPPPPRKVTVRIIAYDAGSISSDPKGVQCSAAPSSGWFGGSGPGTVQCEASFAAGSRVTLLASGPLSSWGIDCASVTTTSCALALSADRTVVANFSRLQPIGGGSPAQSAPPSPPSGTRTITVKVIAGDGGGNVVLPGGANCGVVGGQGEAICRVTSPVGSTVILQSAPTNTAVLTAWGPGCSPGGAAPTCAISVSADVTVSATFAKR